MELSHNKGAGIAGGKRTPLVRGLEFRGQAR